MLKIAIRKIAKISILRILFFILLIGTSSLRYMVYLKKDSIFSSASQESNLLNSLIVVSIALATLLSGILFILMDIVSHKEGFKRGVEYERRNKNK